MDRILEALPEMTSKLSSAPAREVLGSDLDWPVQTLLCWALLWFFAACGLAKALKHVGLGLWLRDLAALKKAFNLTCPSTLHNIQSRQLKLRAAPVALVPDGK